MGKSFWLSEEDLLQYKRSEYIKYFDYCFNKKNDLVYFDLETKSVLNIDCFPADFDENPSSVTLLKSGDDHIGYFQDNGLYVYVDEISKRRLKKHAIVPGDFGSLERKEINGHKLIKVPDKCFSIKGLIRSFITAEASKRL